MTYGYDTVLPYTVGVITGPAPDADNENDVLGVDADGNPTWLSNYHRYVSPFFDNSGTPYTAVLPDLKYYRAKIHLTTPTVAVWALHLVGGAELYDYVVFPSTGGPASATVVAGAIDVAFPATAIVLPTDMMIEVNVYQSFLSWQYGVKVTTWNAAGDIEQILAEGSATFIADATAFVMDGPMTAAAANGSFVGG